MDVITKYLMRPSSEIKALQSYAKNRDSDSPPPHKHLHHFGVVVVEEEALAGVEGCDGLHIVFAVFPIVGFQMVATNFFLSIGMSKKAIFLSLTRQMLFLIPCLILLPPLLGTLGVWISMPIADTVAAIVTAIVLVKQFKQFKYGT